MEHTTYSFLDLTGALSHAQLGNYIFTGQGVGSVTVAYATDKSAHDLAADGVVMVSKLAGKQGTLTIACQQTSALHKWLLKSLNKLFDLPTSEWAQMSATLRNTSDGTSHIITGISFGKHPDKAYAATGAQVTWTLWAAFIDSNVS
jgi:hypothetical protein